MTGGVHLYVLSHAHDHSICIHKGITNLVWLTQNSIETVQFSCGVSETKALQSDGNVPRRADLHSGILTDAHHPILVWMQHCDVVRFCSPNHLCTPAAIQSAFTDQTHVFS